MKTTRLSDLPEPIRDSLAEALHGEGLILNDDQGLPQASLLPLKLHALKSNYPASLPEWPGTVTTSMRREELYSEV
jgi:hypothetical protein